MRQFLKFVLATIVGVVLLTLIGIGLLAGLAGAASSGDKVSVKSNSVLKLNLNTAIEERTTDVPISFGPDDDNNTIGVLDLKTALRQAKTDPNIKGIYLQSEYPQAGWASLEEIRNALIDFKTSKKFVYAYAETMTEKGYYLASVADKIYLNPAGDLEWNGLNAELSFFKGTLDKLGIKPEVFRVGEFKSAVEPFLLDKASPANRLQVSSFLNSINRQMLVGIARSRGLRADSLSRYADRLAINDPTDALRLRLVTHIGFRDQLEAEMKKVLGLGEKKKIDYISLDKYEDAEKDTGEEGGSDRIAVLVASGDIIDGPGGSDNIGSATFVKELKKLRDNDRIKAVVLRINSGGGSALASDVMLRELQLTDAVKPVIVSMSDYAASGGYYMAIGGRKIVAEPNTITGSIGVFSLLFNTETFFRDKLGVTYDRIMTNENADFPATTHEMSPFQKARYQASTNKVYATFTQKVATARHLPVDSVRRMAGGRVWTGTQAKAIGLVDMLGGLDDAVKLAATTAKLGEGDYKVRYYPRKKEFFEQLTASFGSKKDEEARALAQLGDLAPYVKYLQKIKHLQGTQMRIPYEMEIR